ncbi:hypothetical protein FHR24_000638 [Wenyingzhuangia heitensis]|uniref:DUF4350 domain-containing protein n=1 Tax=Wenyingzhuangia heitensis TaxID=1487859 RepID=A0ABX0U787_9FLAO|nr:hypothetical protein [Wenyingzhuangia heitensis]NIJ44199.1 hypothetical protein [Wenyingzhuangia heitensis]
MKKKGFIILGIVLVVLVIILDSITPKKIIWEKTYNESNSNPFDLEVFYKQLPAVFKNHKIVTIKKTFYEYTEQNPLTKKKQNNIYINIDEGFFPDKISTKKLLKFIGNGNIAFVSANEFSKTLLDSLGILKSKKSKNSINTPYLKLYLNNTTDTLKIATKLKYSQTYFKDSIPVKSLGKVSYTTKDSVVNTFSNFIEIPYKKGFFYLYTQPDVFTNYHLLAIPNTDYINQVLSYLPKKVTTANTNTQTIYFESNFKGDPDLANSPLRFIKKQKELYFAWILILVAIALFLLINAKRKQKIIPIIPKVRNTSLDFVETIATLYEEADNFQPMIVQKINIFYKNIRQKHNIITDNTNEKLAKQLSLKSGYDAQKTKELIRFINVLKQRNSSSITLLKKLNKEIEDFNKKTNAWKN